MIEPGLAPPSAHLRDTESFDSETGTRSFGHRPGRIAADPSRARVNAAGDPVQSLLFLTLNCGHGLLIEPHCVLTGISDTGTRDDVVKLVEQDVLPCLSIGLPR